MFMRDRFHASNEKMQNKKNNLIILNYKND